ncbi:DUF397 domain-containing protein [Streptomyces inhibens]|uniref:DUF397 domain-containing protein n=1 Tax=Streptomyces inhibens TaxID=2293571 RepID=UPI00247A7315|nr:DUF397 domain-containing protein [Streptomyces inhibens]UKY55186.1 DUF397 domain-containing protein [Streptomyces inhibens]
MPAQPCQLLAFRTGQLTPVRDSKGPDDSVIVFRAEVWLDFIAAVRRGEFFRSRYQPARPGSPSANRSWCGCAEAPLAPRRSTEGVRRSSVLGLFRGVPRWHSVPGELAGGCIPS